MCRDALIRRFAGLFILATVALGVWIHPGWFAATAFVGFNLLQSSFTSFCPLERVLGRLHWLGCRPHSSPG